VIGHVSGADEQGQAIVDAEKYWRRVDRLLAGVDQREIGIWRRSWRHAAGTLTSCQVVFPRRGFALTMRSRRRAQ